MPAIVVLGAQWGDEGKGKIVDHLAERAAMVVRYQGGNNAGHTVVIGDTTLKLHQVPSGITRPHVAAVMGNGMVINPPALLEELDTLNGMGVSTDNLHISASAHLVMPYHLLLDDLQERMRGTHAIGTTKKGIGPAYVDKFARWGLRVQDLIDPQRFRERAAIALERANRELECLYGHPPLSLDDVVAEYAPAAARMAPHVKDTSLMISRALERGEVVVMEGAQATMLDIDFGTYPYVTSSSPTAGGACQGAGVSPLAVVAVLGVVKAYTSRVGMGPFPTELTDEVGDWIVEKGNEYGTTTGRRRRCGWIDLVSLRYSARTNGFSGIALSRLDVLSGLESVKLCTAYRLADGSTTCEYPAHDSALLEGAQPVYEEVPGWSGDISGARAFGELPEAAQAYCRRVSDVLKVPIDMISVGAERSDLVALRWPV